ncbi:hypothetical protein [Lysobacter antibioticus]|jgi:hypothetical protein|uniref:hypothetical protein n=1 Tax=Lysobacter antibioticus TaxID=84531 RepID=UPI0011DF21F3|nr:hypothetical protein [Lysobacter antibioticus]
MTIEVREIASLAARVRCDAQDRCRGAALAFVSSQDAPETRTLEDVCARKKRRKFQTTEQEIRQCFANLRFWLLV